MPQFHPDELAQWVSRPWENGSPAEPITGISKDTRTLMPGELYIALCGDHFDGHDFIAAAFAKGAAGALVDAGTQNMDGPFLQVPDTLAGLQDLARGYRRKWKGVVVGITGSVGKTTVKEMCADVLSMAGETHRTAGNQNNHIGLPLTMLAMPEAAKYGVFEIGMNHPGEIGPLSDLLQPGIGILTDICNAHREHFGSLEEIALEKAELAWRIPSAGTVILDRDSEWYELMRSRASARMVTVSMGSTADYVGHAVTHHALRITNHEFPMPLPGEHIMRNALRAIALGLGQGMAPPKIDEGLRKFKLPPMRWETSEVHGVRFINDAYNANPLSMHANLQTFSELSGTGKKWAVLGGMLELGDTTEEEHAELGRFIDGLRLDGVVVVGAVGQLIACKGAQAFFKTQETAEAAQILKDHLHAGDRVLLKASRGEQLERVLEYFKEM